jgi:hypothetical protein
MTNSNDSPAMRVEELEKKFPIRVLSPQLPPSQVPTHRAVVIWAGVAVLIALAVVRSAIATRNDGFTVDEPWHIAAGVSYVSTGSFALNPEHPPLVKLWAGLSQGHSLKMPPLRRLATKADERNFVESIVYLDNDPLRVQARTRLGMFVFNVLLLMFLAVAVSRALSPLAAVCVVLFLAIDPTIAAHLPVVMTDLSVGLLSVTASLLVVHALRDGRKLDVLLASLALGLTLGAKHSGLVTLVALVVYCALAVSLPYRSIRAGSRARTAAIAFAIILGAWLVVWSLYGFRYSESRSGEEAFNRPLALKIEDVQSPVARRSLRFLADGHLLPRSYIWGLADTIRAGFERGIPVNFFGRSYSPKDVPVYYFPVELVAKLPLGLLALAIAGLVLLLRRRAPFEWQVPLLGLILLGSVWLIVLTRGVPYAGIRHALALLVVAALLGGIAVAAAVQSNSRTAKAAVALVLLAAIVSAVPRARPWEYFNEAFGGPDKAYLRFGDESVDVGQRTLDFIRYYRQTINAAEETPYLQYVAGPSQIEWMQRLGVHARSVRAGSDFEQEDISGTFFVRSLHVMRDWRGSAFRKATPAGRIGNLLIYRGTFHMPWTRLDALLSRAQRDLFPPHPNVEDAERSLQKVLASDPETLKAYPIYGFLATAQMGNVMLLRGDREGAKHFYGSAIPLTQSEPARKGLQAQIARLSSGDPLSNIPPLPPGGE